MVKKHSAVQLTGSWRTEIGALDTYGMIIIYLIFNMKLNLNFIYI
jgi:hypothetical protein